MSFRTRGLVVLLLQCAIVCTIALRFAWERTTRPRVWVRTAMIDPDLPVRGRYLYLSVEVDACDFTEYQKAVTEQERALQNAARIAKEQGRPPASAQYTGFVPQVAAGVRSAPDRLVAVAPGRRRALQLQVRPQQDCHNVVGFGDMPYFVPETTNIALHREQGEELWMEVTVPPEGPPRPIQLARKKNGVWEPLALR